MLYQVFYGLTMFFSFDIDTHLYFSALDHLVNIVEITQEDLDLYIAHGGFSAVHSSSEQDDDDDTDADGKNKKGMIIH